LEKPAEKTSRFSKDTNHKLSQKGIPACGLSVRGRRLSRLRAVKSQKAVASKGKPLLKKESAKRWNYQHGASWEGVLMPSGGKKGKSKGGLFIHEGRVTYKRIGEGEDDSV